MDIEQKSPLGAIGILGLGWVGKRVAESLQSQGVPVWGTVTTYEKAKNLREEGVDARVLRLPEDLQLSKLPATDILIYTIPPRGGQDRAEEMIRKAIQIGEELQVRAAIYLSSTSAYPANGGWVKESDAEAIPSRHTGIQIKVLEDLWSEASYPATILRFGGLYGPGRSPGRFMKNHTIKNPTAYVNMTHQRDAVESISRVIRKAVWGEVLNIVSVNNQTRKEFYSQFLDDPKIGPEATRPSKQVSVQRAQQLLGSDFLANNS